MVETPSGVSETVPDEVPSIKQLLQRHMAGQDLDPGSVRQPIFNDGDFDSDDLEELKRFDLAEKHEYQQTLARDIETRKKNLEAAEKAIQEKKLAAKKAKQEKIDQDKGRSHESADSAGRVKEVRLNKDSDGMPTNRVGPNTDQYSREE